MSSKKQVLYMKSLKSVNNDTHFLCYLAFVPPAKMDIFLFIFCPLTGPQSLALNSDFPKALNTFCSFVTNLTWTDVRIIYNLFFFLSHWVWLLMCLLQNSQLRSTCYRHSINFLKCKEFLNPETSMALRVLTEELWPLKVLYQ